MQNIALDKETQYSLKMQNIALDKKKTQYSLKMQNITLDK